MQENEFKIPTNLVKEYANHLINEGFALDVSGTATTVLHAPSNYEINLTELGNMFPRWLKEHKTEPCTAEYYGSLDYLPSRLRHSLPRVYGRSFQPSDNKIFVNRRGAPLANTYIPYKPALSGVFDMPEILQDYLDRLFPDKLEQKRTVQFLADIVQNPMERPQFALMLTGEQGCGKSSCIDLVRMALGNNHVWSDNSYQSAFEQFSEVFPDHLIVCFDDAPANANTYERLKRIITAREMECQIKNKQNRVEREVYARIVICSNNPRPLRLESGDRRFYCPSYCRHKESVDETAEFFTKFVEWKEKNQSLIYHWLATVELDDFAKGSCEKTATHRGMVDLSSTMLEDAVSLFLENIGHRAFHYAELSEYLAQQNISSPPDLVKSIVTKNGFEWKRRKLTAESNQIHVFQPVSIDGKRAAAFTSGELKAISKYANPAF